MKVLHKKNQGKSMRNEGVYSCVSEGIVVGSMFDYECRLINLIPAMAYVMT